MSRANVAKYRIAGLAICSFLLFGCGGGYDSSAPTGPLVGDASLSSLSVTAATLDPAFSPSVFTYTATVPNGTNSVDVFPTTTDSLASFTINGGGSATVPLVVGDNTISIVVTGQYGTASSTYTIVVTRAPLSTGPEICTGGSAGDFPCSGVSLRKRVSLETMGGTLGNDIWGWSDAQSGNEYALMGMTNGTAFVDITNPQNPVFLGLLPTETVTTDWRDIKVYQDFAYIVADFLNIVADNDRAHGMQVFDLTRLRGLMSPQTFSADVVYGDFRNAHNIAINEESGFAYAVGTDTCGGGLHIIDISTPINPTFAGCYSLTDTHDTQCVNYQGPDAVHVNREICVSSNGDFPGNNDHIGIVDVTDKTAPVTISSTVYPQLGFAHQGWLTEDHRFFLMGDELDERDFIVPTRTHVFDLSDLDAPVYVFAYEAATTSIDHNLYVLGNRVFQANYTSGLRVLEFGDLANEELVEIAFFDTFPASDATDFSGAWSVYPYLPSGTIIVSDRSNGLFILSLQ
jgi:choice-of-anchor B domain-containing protein